MRRITQLAGPSTRGPLEASSSGKKEKQRARASTAAVAAKLREQPNTRRRRRTVVTWFVSANADFLPAISFARPFLAIAWSHKQEQEDQSGTTSQECLLNFLKWFGIRREGLVAKQGRFELVKRQAKKKIKRREDGWVLRGDSEAMSRSVCCTWSWWTMQS